jgi:hypothetical protein
LASLRLEWSAAHGWFSSRGSRALRRRRGGGPAEPVASNARPAPTGRAAGGPSSAALVFGKTNLPHLAAAIL